MVEKLIPDFKELGFLEGAFEDYTHWRMYNFIMMSGNEDEKVIQYKNLAKKMKKITSVRQAQKEYGSWIKEHGINAPLITFREKNDRKLTLLLLAVNLDKPFICKWLIDNGADPFSFGFYSSIFFAVVYGELEIIEILLKDKKHRAEINSPILDKGWNETHYLVEVAAESLHQIIPFRKKFKEDKNHPLLKKIVARQLECVKLLVSLGADPLLFLQVNWMGSLTENARRQNFKMVNYFLAKGAPVVSNTNSLIVALHKEGDYYNDIAPLLRPIFGKVKENDDVMVALDIEITRCKEGLIAGDSYRKNYQKRLESCKRKLTSKINVNNKEIYTLWNMMVYELIKPYRENIISFMIWTNRMNINNILIIPSEVAQHILKFVLPYLDQGELIRPAKTVIHRYVPPKLSFFGNIAKDIKELFVAPEVHPPKEIHISRATRRLIHENCFDDFDTKKMRAALAKNCPEFPIWHYTFISITFMEKCRRFGEVLLNGNVKYAFVYLDHDILGTKLQEALKVMGNSVYEAIQRISTSKTISFGQWSERDPIKLETPSRGKHNISTNEFLNFVKYTNKLTEPDVETKDIYTLYDEYKNTKLKPH